MTRYVAFLRGLNVGGHTVKMDRLRAHVGDLGAADVATYIASGNVIFSADGAAGDWEARIEAHLADVLGYEVATFVRTTDEVAALAALDPFPGVPRTEATRLHIGFLRAAQSAAAVAAVRARSVPGDDLDVIGREVFWLRDGRMTDSALAPDWGRPLEGPVTMRNANTVQKIAAKYSG